MALSPTEFAEEARAADHPLNALYRDHWRELHNYVRRKFGPGPPDPDDITQAAFLRCSERTSLDDLVNPRAYLFRVVHNVAVEEHRRERLRASKQARSVIALDSTDDHTPERVSIGRDRCRLLARAFTSLPPRTRRILVMSREDGLSFAEIARRTGLSQTQVKRLMSEALLKCRAAVEGGDE